MNDAGPALLKVKDLTTRVAGDWQIRCTVNKKHPIRQHAKGKLFKIDLLDDQDRQSMIEGTFYTEETDLFWHRIAEGKTYLISKAEISSANKKFTSIKHDFRLIFKAETQLDEVPES